MKIGDKEYDDEIIVRLQIVTEYLKRLLTCNKARDIGLGYYGFDEIPVSVKYIKKDDTFEIDLYINAYTNHDDINKRARTVAWNIFAGKSSIIAKELNKVEDWDNLYELKLGMEQFNELSEEIMRTHAYNKLKGEI